MAFYGMSDLDLLDMPIQRFWLLESNVSRIQAERDTRALRVSLGQHNPQEVMQTLATEMGTVYVETHPARDENATSTLKALSGV